MPRALQEVVFVDGVRTPFGKAGEKGMYAQTRADDLVIKCIRELLRRHPELPKERVEEVAIAATTQSNRGLCGVLVVRDPEEPAFDGERVLLFDDLELNRRGQLAAPDQLLRYKRGPQGEVLLVNGVLEPEMQIATGQVERWRLVNTTSARVGAGLGTIARVVASGEAIYRGKLQFAEAEARISRCWAPYHAELARLLGETQARHGACLLIDCHSMPGGGAASGRTPDFVLGDAHGTACAPQVTRLVEAVLTELGYQVKRNDPYAGGFVTRHYGRPRDGVHALQIEISRGLYMDEARIEKRPEFGQVRAHLSALAARLAAEAPSLLRSG